MKGGRPGRTRSSATREYPPGALRCRVREGSASSGRVRSFRFPRVLRTPPPHPSPDRGPRMRIQRLAVASFVLAFVARSQPPRRRPAPTELGVFGQFTRADEAWQTDNGFGLGGRLGIFLNRRWELEGTFSTASFDNKPPRAAGNEQRSDLQRPDQFQSAVRVGRSNARPHCSRAAPADSASPSHTDFSVPYGGGLRIHFNDAVALRLDAIVEYVENPTAATFGFPPVVGVNTAAARSTNLEIRAGLSFLLGNSKAPRRRPPPAPPPPRREAAAAADRAASPAGAHRSRTRSEHRLDRRA